MSFTLACRMCGGSVEASDADIRKSIVQCSYCGNYFHINENGMELASQALESNKIPPKIKISETPSGLNIKLYRTTAVIDTKFFLRYGAIAFISLLAAGSVSSSVGINSGILGIIAFVILVIISKSLFPLHDYIILKNGFLFNNKEKIAVGDIKQLYCSSNNFGNEFSWSNVYVLLKNNDRKQLTYYIAEPERALYVEEYLEVHLEILDVDVYGSAKVSIKKEGLSGEKDFVSESPCESCGAKNSVSEKEWAKGMLTCEFCGSLSLIYDPTTNKPTMGIPDENSLEQITIVRKEEATLFFIDGKKSFEISGDLLLSREGQIPANQFKCLKILEKEFQFSNLPDAADGISALVGSLKDMQKRMSYSEDLKIGLTTHNLIAVDIHGREFLLLEGIQDFLEIYAIRNLVTQELIQ